MTDGDLKLAIGVGLGLLALRRFVTQGPGAADYGTDAFGELAGAIDAGAAALLGAAPAPPTPAPGGAPAPIGSSGAGDAFDLAAATIVNAPDFRGWPITTTIRRVTMDGANLRIAFDAENEWPDIVPPGFEGPIQYTVCAFLNIGGDWIGSAFIQMWRGRDGVGDAPSDFARNWWYSSRWGEMAGHQLAPGEAFGLCVIPGNGRDNVGPIPFAARSQVVVVPAVDQGDFSFG